MGQCCEKLGGTKQQQESGKDIPLAPTKPALASHQNTRNDAQFTYFMGVFELLSLGEKLETPSYIDQLHPEFSYQKFNSTYNQYQRVIKSLGEYIADYELEGGPLNIRIDADRQVVENFKAKVNVPNPEEAGCLVKIQLQDLKWPGARQVGITVIHALNWANKFDKWYPVQTIAAGPVFVQFPVPKIKGATVKISCRPGKGEILFDLQDCFKKGQQLYCKIMKWKGASQSEGIAVRMQLISEQRKQQQDRFQQMKALYQKLVKQYGVDGQILMSMNDRDISERLSRHRTSLNNKYNMNQNEMF